METQSSHKIDWSAINWGEAMPRLLYYAASLMRRKGWRGDTAGSSSSAFGPEDIVQTAILKTMSEQRPWDPTNNLDLFTHLAGVIKSEMSNLSRSVDNRLVLNMPENLEARAAGTAFDASRIIEGRSELEGVRRFVLENAPDLRGLLDAMLSQEGISANELSKTLRVSEAEVWNMRKRLRRLIGRYQSERMENENV